MAYTFNTELKSVAYNYIKTIQARVTENTITKEIEEHPYYPSLLALSDTFSRNKIVNGAFKVQKDDFVNILKDTPFVAFMNVEGIGQDFVLVTEASNERVKYYHKKNKSNNIPLEKFLAEFKEIVWKAELTETSGQSDYLQKLNDETTARKNRVLLWLGTMLAYCLVFFANSTAENILPLTIITAIKLVGFVATCLLLIYEIDKNNPFVKNICSLTTKTNCEAVLNSKASKIAGVSWGEIGFFYFASTLLGLLLPIVPFAIKISWLSIGNAFAAPYIIFSLYFQWKIIKQWCPLCLVIQATLFAEFFWALIFVWQKSIPFLFDTSILLSLIFALLCPVLLWYGLKPILKKNNDHDLYLAAYKRLQYNPDIFNNLLKQQAMVLEGWQDLGIELGNPNASHTIIKICNPYCGPCDKAHPLLEDLIETNSDVKLKVIYINRNSEIDKGRFIIKHLLAIASENNQHNIKHALDDWYISREINKDYQLFAQKYPKDERIIEKQSTKMDDMNQWCDRADVTHTPTIFVDGYRLPENYEIAELKYIL